VSEFVFLFRATEAERREAMSTPDRAQQSLQAWLDWMRQLDAGGHLKDRGRPLEHGGAVVRGRKKVVTDGPYAETKDLLLGFIVVEARDLDEAVTLASACPLVAGGGSVEVRPVDTLQL
jgi:hypothetical protein